MPSLFSSKTTVESQQHSLLCGKVGGIGGSGAKFCHDRGENLSPIVRALQGDLYGPARGVPVFDPKKSSNFVAPSHPSPHPISQATALSSQVVTSDSRPKSLEIVAKSPENWRDRLPRVAASPKVVSLADAVAECDKIICGQVNVKKRLALSFGAGAFTAERFYYFLQGPAGVGKTSLATTLGAIYGRPVVIIRCDSVSSVEDLFGYGPNWKSPGPGRMTKAIIQSGSTNSIIFLDEIDKISGEKKDVILGSLNEFLSRETISYRDHYLQCDVDISKVSFLCAANSSDVFDRIPWLRSRMGQILPFTGYTRSDLAQILSDYLLPLVNTRTWTSLAPPEMQRGLTLTSEARDYLIERYLEAYGEHCGVRELKDWLLDLFTGHLQLGTPGRPVTCEWLTEHWNMLYPGHHTKSSLHQSLNA